MYVNPTCLYTHVLTIADHLTWSCKAYNAFVGGQDGDNEAFEADLSSLYPGLDNVIESGPACIVDKRGVIVLFLVPDALMTSRQVRQHFCSPSPEFSCLC